MNQFDRNQLQALSLGLIVQTLSMLAAAGLVPRERGTQCAADLKTLAALLDRIDTPGQLPLPLADSCHTLALLLDRPGKYRG